MGFYIRRLVRKNCFPFLMLMAVVASLVSCTPQKHIVLMQNQDNGPTVFDAVDSITSRYKLQVNDYLFVNVSSANPKLSVFFNPRINEGSRVSTQDNNFYHYQIDDQMNIDFPVVGKICLKGCNVIEAKQRISDAISPYLADFSIIVRLASNSFTILGEVNSQGVKVMARDQVTIYDAVAQAGGFTSFARRKEVKLLRKDEQGKVHMYVLDLTDDNVINSDYYYIYPNDILYVRPLKSKIFGFGETITLGLITSLLSLGLLIFNLIK